MKHLKRISALLLAVLFVACALMLVSCGKDEDTDGKEVNITLVVVDNEAKETRFEIKTTRKYLADALLDEKLVSGTNGDYGLMIDTVNGLKADYNVDQSYWALYEGEEYAMVGASALELKDGGIYKLVYTKG